MLILLKKPLFAGLSICKLLIVKGNIFAYFRKSGVFQPNPGSGLTLFPPRAPKVTVTRGGYSLCQKGCYPMAHMFLVKLFLAFVCVWGVVSKLKRAGGRAASLQLAPPCGRIPATSAGGAGGGGIFPPFGNDLKTDIIILRLHKVNRTKARNAPNPDRMVAAFRPCLTVTCSHVNTIIWL